MDENFRKLLMAAGAYEVEEGVFILEVVHADGCPRPQGGECICPEEVINDDSRT